MAHYPEPLRLKKTAEFGNWYDGLRDTLRARIDARLDRIQKYGHFGGSRDLGRGLLELKWKDGARVYFSLKRIEDVDVVILWGGHKGTQSQDIRKARKIKSQYENTRDEESKKTK